MSGCLLSHADSWRICMFESFSSDSGTKGTTAQSGDPLRTRPMSYVPLSPCPYHTNTWRAHCRCLIHIPWINEWRGGKWECGSEGRLFCRTFPSHKIPEKLLLFLCLQERSPESGVGDKEAGWTGVQWEQRCRSEDRAQARYSSFSEGPCHGETRLPLHRALRRKRICLLDLNDMFIDFSGAVHS